MIVHPLATSHDKLRHAGWDVVVLVTTQVHHAGSKRSFRERNITSPENCTLSVPLCFQTKRRTSPNLYKERMTKYTCADGPQPNLAIYRELHTMFDLTSPDTARTGNAKADKQWQVQTMTRRGGVHKAYGPNTSG